MTFPATQGFGGTSLANMDLNRFRTGLDTAERTVSVASGLQYLQMQKRDGAWIFGKDRMEVQDGSEWAVNPMSLETGFVAWGSGGGKPLGQVMRTIFGPAVLQSELPHVGAEWVENVGLRLRCLNGDDAGVEVEYTQNSYGGKAAFAELVKLFKAQLDLDPSRLIPVIGLEFENYRHPSYGEIFNPIFAVKRWVAESELPMLTTPQANEAAPAAPVAQPAPPPVAAAAPAPRGRGRPPASAAAPAAAAAPAPVAAAAAPAAATATRRRRAAV